MLVNLEQGTQAWLAWRKMGIGASDAPVIMGESPFSTPRKLWEQKKGFAPPSFKNAAMQRGNDLEAAARAAYEEKTGIAVIPVCVEREDAPHLRASLDGMSVFGDLIVEIKCPGAVTHQKALDGEVPRPYWIQIQYQMLVSGVQAAHYWSFDGEKGVLLTVEPDLDFQQLLEVKAGEFWDSLELDEYSYTAPTQPVPDDDWDSLAAAWLQAKSALDFAKAEEEAVKERLIALLGAQKKRSQGGVAVSQSVRKGALLKVEDFCEKQGYDLTSCPRGKESITFRVAPALKD